jgi:multidrug transporter EmrE-like cation transporter
MKWFVPFSLLMVFEIVGNFFTGLFGSIQNFFLIPLILLVYTIANYFWLQALKKGSGLARGTIYFGVGVVIVSALIGFVFYEEALTLLKIGGIGLGIISLFLMSDIKLK